MHDLRLAIRSLRAVVALATLALCIGANTPIFNFINGLILDRFLVSLWERTPSGRRSPMTTVNHLNYAPPLLRVATITPFDAMRVSALRS
jgi:hypothetical protein